MAAWRRALLMLAGACALALASPQAGILPDGRTLELTRARFGPDAVARLVAWREMVQGLAGLSEWDKLVRVNRFFNRLPNVDDAVQWGRRDHWATPVELLAVNGGDCEDFALAKYFSLRAAGVAPERLRITYVRAWLPRQARVEAHMVLAYYPRPEDEPLILDNLIDDIRPAAQRTDLTPTMSFNADGLWSARQRGQSGRIGAASDIRHWNELLARIDQERAAPVTGARP